MGAQNQQGNVGPQPIQGRPGGAMQAAPGMYPGGAGGPGGMNFNVGPQPIQGRPGGLVGMRSPGNQFALPTSMRNPSTGMGWGAAQGAAPGMQQALGGLSGMQQAPGGLQALQQPGMRQPTGAPGQPKPR